MSLKNKFTENIILPLSDLALGQSVYKSLNFLKKSQWWSREQIDDYQNKRLRMLIEHSVASVPYYSDLFHKLNLKVEDIQTKTDLHKIPILTKAEITKNGKEKFLSTSYSINKLVSSSSSGSTGEPLFYKTTKEAYSLNIAANLRGWSWMGFNIGDKYIKLSQNPRKNPIKRIQDRISNNLYLATNPLIESNFIFILTEIERYQPKVIRCYPDPLLFIARYKKQHPEFTYQPNAITTTGNTLYPETREEIEDAFGCKVFDSYSCEGNSNVFECSTHNAYHSTEVLDDFENPIKKGNGRLISTDLYNFAHPFIRYDTQDQVELDSTPCSCGRKLLRYNRILGRSNDIITSSSGQKFIVHNFTGFFQTDHKRHKRAIQHFQVVKTKDQHVELNLVVNDAYDESVESFILEYWQDQLKCPVRVNIVDEIPLTKSGKRRFIINQS